MRDRRSSLIRIVVTSAVLVIGIFTFVHFGNSESLEKYRPSLPSDHSGSVHTNVALDHSDHNLWTFDPSKDSRNLGLSDSQCDAAFPRLYEQLDRMRDHLGPKSVSQSQVAFFTNKKPYSHTQVHVLIHSGQLYIINEQAGACNRARALATLSNLYRAIISLPDPTASVSYTHLTLPTKRIV